MWCSNCQQDIPAVAHAVHGRIVCSQCQRPMRKHKAAAAAPISDDGIALDEIAANAPPRSKAGQSRDHARLLGRSRLSAITGTSRRFQPPQISFDDIKLATSPDLHLAAAQIAPSSATISRRRESGQIAAWLTVLAGVAALGCGVGLCGWSLWAERGDLWNLALALTLGGQGLLIFGLVLVVSRLWRNSRYATSKLQSVHAQLAQLQRSADELAASRGGAPTFYADLARSASPQMLLANLKGQVDQLTMRLGGGP